MSSKGQQVRFCSVSGIVFPEFSKVRSLFWLAAVLALTLGPMAMGQTEIQQPGNFPFLDVRNLVTLGQQCGAPQAVEQSFRLVQQEACNLGRGQSGRMLAFEENPLFIYALAQMSPAQGDKTSAQWLRRFFLLKPATFVVEDLVYAADASTPTCWTLNGSTHAPMIENGHYRITHEDREIDGQCLSPGDADFSQLAPRLPHQNGPELYHVQVTPKQASREVRFLHVFHVYDGTRQGIPERPVLTKRENNLELSVSTLSPAFDVSTLERVFDLTLPKAQSVAGTIKVASTEGESLLARRLLPAGIMPHGPEGVRLLERWDKPYRGAQAPGWDVGRPSSHLVEVIEAGTFPQGRAIVLGCGSGTNAIYLARKGFKVTGVDVAPSALTLAKKKADQEGLKLDWVLADVVALPELGSFDLIFDRGCYHHICQYNSPAYVETLRRLSHAGTRALILAGSPADGNRGGPPRIPEKTIRSDFSTLFTFEWLRNIHFDTRNANAQGPSAWSIHLQRKEQ